MAITAADIQQFENHEEYNGWGYIGHSLRTQQTDHLLAVAATQLKLDREDTFLWANSRPGRHFMDGQTFTIEAFKAELQKQLPSLRAEVGR